MTVCHSICVEGPWKWFPPHCAKIPLAGGSLWRLLKEGAAVLDGTPNPSGSCATLGGLHPSSVRCGSFMTLCNGETGGYLGLEGSSPQTSCRSANFCASLLNGKPQGPNIFSVRCSWYSICVRCKVASLNTKIPFSMRSPVVGGCEEGEGSHC